MLKNAKGENAKKILPRARAWPPARPPSASGGASGTENFLKSQKIKFSIETINKRPYEPKNPSGWHYLLEKSSPEMDSNPNSNGWNRI